MGESVKNLEKEVEELRSELARAKEELLYYKNDDSYYRYLARDKEMQIDMVIETIENIIDSLKQGNSKDTPESIALGNLSAKLKET